MRIVVCLTCGKYAIIENDNFKKFSDFHREERQHPVVTMPADRLKEVWIEEDVDSPSINQKRYKKETAEQKAFKEMGVEVPDSWKAFMTDR